MCNHSSWAMLLSIAYHFTWLHCTVLGSSTGWVVKSLISSKWVLNLSYRRPRVLKGQILCLGQFLGQIWAIFGPRRPKNGQKKNFKIFDLLLLFVTIVIRSFNIYNWCIGLVYHSYQLLVGIQIQILYLDQFLNQFWANFGLRRPNNCHYFQNCWYSTAFF